MYQKTRYYISANGFKHNLLLIFRVWDFFEVVNKSLTKYINQQMS